MDERWYVPAETQKSEYIYSTETARLVRKALKLAFPGQKFYVRTSNYSGGASIDISWMDGPNEAQVKAVTVNYEGSGFDGMIDLKFGYYSWLCPDGSVHLAGTRGTEGNMGSCSGFWNNPPVPGAKLVHFGADFIFLRRASSFGMLTEAALKVTEEFGIPAPQVDVRPWLLNGKYRKEQRAEFVTGANWNTWEWREFQKALQEITRFPEEEGDDEEE